MRYMKNTILMALCVVLLGTGVAFAGSTDMTFSCYKGGKGNGPAVGSVLVEISFWGKTSLSRIEQALKCEEKYPSACGGECWICTDKRGLDAVLFETCWSSDGKCVGADC